MFIRLLYGLFKFVCISIQGRDTFSDIDPLACHLFGNFTAGAIACANPSKKSIIHGNMHARDPSLLAVVPAPLAVLVYSRGRRLSPRRLPATTRCRRCCTPPPPPDSSPNSPKSRSSPRRSRRSSSRPASWFCRIRAVAVALRGTMSGQNHGEKKEEKSADSA